MKEIQLVGASETTAAKDNVSVLDVLGLFRRCPRCNLPTFSDPPSQPSQPLSPKSKQAYSWG
jgi:hypothetical protein